MGDGDCTTKCPVCDHSVPPSRGSRPRLYCSPRCLKQRLITTRLAKLRSATINRLSNRKSKVCVICKARFRPARFQWGNQKYCSSKCRVKEMNERKAEYKKAWAKRHPPSLDSIARQRELRRAKTATPEYRAKNAERQKLWYRSGGKEKCKQYKSTDKYKQWNRADALKRYYERKSNGPLSEAEREKRRVIGLKYAKSKKGRAKQREYRNTAKVKLRRRKEHREYTAKQRDKRNGLELLSIVLQTGAL